MSAAPWPENEQERLRALVETGVLDSAPEPGFDGIVKVARELCGTNIALVSLVDADRQWFKAKVGLDPSETAREHAFCAHAILSKEAFVITDAQRDARFADNPYVTGEPNIRFYAGVPLRLSDGAAVGTLCVLDDAPHQLSKAQLASLSALAHHVATELQLRRELGATQPTRDSVAGSRNAPLASGAVVAGHYNVVREIGRGGVGVVYAARNLHDGSLAAIKVLLGEGQGGPEPIERFAREARVSSSLRGKHVARVLDVGNLASGEPYIVTEYLQGKDLQRVLEARAPLPVREALRCVRQVCEALEEAHARGIVHRDIKPSNLFIAETASGATVKLLDFGLAKSPVAEDKAALTLQKSTLGTPWYMSPEQMLDASDVDARSDVWSLGVVLYECLTGQRPFGGRSMLECAASVLRDTPIAPRALRPELPEGLQAIVMRCLEKERDKRFASARELRQALTPFSDASPRELRSLVLQ